METVSVLFPSLVLTVIVAVPRPFEVTRPLEETVATEVLLEVQVTALFVAFAGRTVAFSCTVPPYGMVFDSMSRVTPVTGTVVEPELTVTLQVSVYVPSKVVTVMIALPAALAVTVPAELTVAAVVFELFQETALFTASVGDTVGTSFSELPTVKEMASLFRVTPVTALSTGMPVPIGIWQAEAMAARTAVNNATRTIMA